MVISRSPLADNKHEPKRDYTPLRPPKIVASRRDAFGQGYVIERSDEDDHKFVKRTVGV